MQPKECALIAKHAKKKGYNIWAYTGFTLEELLKLSERKSEIMDFLKEIDVLVDGKFILEKKDYSMKFAGSSNQRILDMKKSLKEMKPIMIEEYMFITKQKGREKPTGIYI